MFTIPPDDARVLVMELLHAGLLDALPPHGLEAPLFRVPLCSKCFALKRKCRPVTDTLCEECSYDKHTSVCDVGELFDLRLRFDRWNRCAASAGIFIRYTELSYEASVGPIPFGRYNLAHLRVGPTEDCKLKIDEANDHLKSLRRGNLQNSDTLAVGPSLGTGLPLRVPAATSYSTAPPSASPDVTTAGSSASGGAPGWFNDVHYNAADHSSTVAQDPHMPSGGEYAQFAGGFDTVHSRRSEPSSCQSSSRSGPHGR